jgi:hypothetical protein
MFLFISIGRVHRDNQTFPRLTPYHCTWFPCQQVWVIFLPSSFRWARPWRSHVTPPCLSVQSAAPIPTSRRTCKVNSLSEDPIHFSLPASSGLHPLILTPNQDVAIALYISIFIISNGALAYLALYNYHV